MDDNTCTIVVSNCTHHHFKIEQQDGSQTKIGKGEQVLIKVQPHERIILRHRGRNKMRAPSSSDYYRTHDEIVLPAFPQRIVISNSKTKDNMWDITGSASADRICKMVKAAINGFG